MGPNLEGICLILLGGFQAGLFIPLVFRLTGWSMLIVVPLAFIAAFVLAAVEIVWFESIVLRARRRK